MDKIAPEVELFIAQNLSKEKWNLFLLNIVRNMEQTLVTSNPNAIPYPTCLFYTGSSLKLFSFPSSSAQPLVSLGSWLHWKPPGKFSNTLTVVLLPLANHCSRHAYQFSQREIKRSWLGGLLEKVFLTDLKKKYNKISDHISLP